MKILESINNHIFLNILIIAIINSKELVISFSLQQYLRKTFFVKILITFANIIIINNILIISKCLMSKTH